MANNLGVAFSLLFSIYIYSIENILKEVKNMAMISIDISLTSIDTFYRQNDSEIE